MKQPLTKVFLCSCQCQSWGTHANYAILLSGAREEGRISKLGQAGLFGLSGEDRDALLEKQALIRCLMCFPTYAFPIGGALDPLAGRGSSLSLRSWNNKQCLAEWFSTFALFKGRSLFCCKQWWELFALDGLGPYEPKSAFLVWALASVRNWMAKAPWSC